MIRWIPYTFVRTLMFFIGGILLGFSNPDLIPRTYSISGAVILGVLYFIIVIFGRRLRRSLNPGLIALPLVFLLGYNHLVGQKESRDPNHLLNTSEEIFFYEAMITRFPEERARSWKAEAQVSRVYTKRWENREGKIILYFSKEDFSRPFQYGDVLVIKGHPQIPDGPANPGEFDYREYLALRNIYHQHFLRNGQVLKTGHAPPSPFKAVAFQGRQWAEATLKKFVKGAREQGIASALVLGVTDGLDNELLNAYAATGSMHILAVSGLHISIIYFILLWIFSPLNKLRHGRWLIAIFALAILWLYAFVTGLSPSVLRAVTMFSFLALARPWGRGTNVYNTLAVSAFCLLLFDPFLIRSVGFQLSYLAVLGIVFLYPRILALWEPQHRISVEVWKISAVAFAAQIATFPLGLLYFHQFPNYFLLSNLLVVPLSFVVLIAGLLLLGVSFVPLIATALGFCLEMVIRLLNAIVFALEGLPFSLIDNVYISAWQCGMLMGFVVMVVCLFQYRKFHYLVVACAIMVAYVSLQWWHFAKDINVQMIAVYKVPGHSAIDLIDRGQTFFVADSGFQNDLQKVRFYIKPNRLITGVSVVDTGPPVARSLKGCKLIAWKGRKILHVTGEDFHVNGPLSVDWLIIGNNALSDIPAITGKVAFEKLVLDSSNSFFFASRFLEAAKLYKLEVHSVWHQGAFIKELENQDS